jgi:hypothetical protein
MPTVTVDGAVTLQEAATALHDKLGGGLVISRMVNEFGVAKKVAAAIEEAFGGRSLCPLSL